MRPSSPTSAAIVGLDRTLFQIHGIRTDRHPPTYPGVTDNLALVLLLQQALCAINASQPLPIQQQDVGQVRKAPNLCQPQIQIRLFVSETFVAIPTDV